MDRVNLYGGLSTSLLKFVRHLILLSDMYEYIKLHLCRVHHGTYT